MVFNMHSYAMRGSCEVRVDNRSWKKLLTGINYTERAKMRETHIL